jgi:hypothetical protein
VILEFSPHRGKKRIPVTGQTVHKTVPEKHRHGRDVDDEEDDEDKIPKPESVPHCGDCYFDKGEKEVIHCLLSLFVTEIFVGLNNFE